MSLDMTVRLTPNKRLFEAISENNVRLVRSFVRHMDVNHPNAYGETPITRAMGCNSDTVIAKILFGSGAILSTKALLSAQTRSKWYADDEEKKRTMNATFDFVKSMIAYNDDSQKRSAVLEEVDATLRETRISAKIQASAAPPLRGPFRDVAQRLNNTDPDLPTPAPAKPDVVEQAGSSSDAVVNSNNDDPPRRRTIAEQVDRLIDDSGLDGIVGLNKVKTVLRSLCRDILLERLRREKGVGLAVGPETKHMVFLGNPGTGKTSVARLLAKIFHQVGVIQANRVVEVQREDLVGQHIGHSEKRTAEIIQTAKGGVLFIDEAYRLYSSSERDFGRQALETIMGFMLDGDPVCVFAGYPEPMQQFLDSNEGLRRRISFYFQFENYSPSELALMMTRRVDSLQYRLTEEASTFLEDFFATFPEALSANTNGGLIDQVFQRARYELNERLTGLEDNPEDLVMLTKRDLMSAGRQLVENFATSQNVMV